MALFTPVSVHSSDYKTNLDDEEYNNNDVDDLTQIDITQEHMQQLRDAPWPPGTPKELRVWDEDHGRHWRASNPLAYQRILTYVKLWGAQMHSVSAGHDSVVMHNVSLPVGGGGDETPIRWLEWRFNKRAFAHDVPRPHADFFFVTTRMNVGASPAKVMSISDSITYYAVGKQITAGCHFLGAAIATLYLARLVADGALSSSDARLRYGTTIMELSRAEKMATNQMLQRATPGLQPEIFVRQSRIILRWE